MDNTEDAMGRGEVEANYITPVKAAWMVKAFKAKEGFTGKWKAVFGVPRGGCVVAVMVAHELGLPIVEEPFSETLAPADVLVVDDIIDSGRTRARYRDNDFFALVIKKTTEAKVFLLKPPMTAWAMETAGWVTFYWEGWEAPAEDAVVRMIQAIGDDPNREGLKETPARVTRSWGELFGGYRQSPVEVLKVFEDGACNEMVVLKDIEFYSTCEHHMLPFFGRVHVGYIPDGKVVGVSKIARLVEVFSRRLQIQERMTAQVADAMMQYLKPKGVMVVCEAKHLCMVARGVGKQNSVMVTSAVRGAFDNEKTRNEFLALAGVRK